MSHHTIPRLWETHHETMKEIAWSVRRGIVVGATGVVLLLGSSGIATAAMIDGTPGNDVMAGTNVTVIIGSGTERNIVRSGEATGTVTGGQLRT